MFTPYDFTKLLNYFKDGTRSDLDSKLIISAENSRSKTITLFNENFDLPAHSSDDYKRLKEFLIIWYASHKTFASVMKDCSDIRSLPEKHLNELLNSFGYTEELGEISGNNKINFFYDLVNLYKIKGTPESIERVLSYFGIPNVELVEYWLQYDSDGKLVLRPEKISSSNTIELNINAQDLNFNYYTSNDPHWMLTENQINQLFLNNKIAFPSKTPYFGLRPVIQLSSDVTNTTLTILIRMVQDQYESYISGTNPEKDIEILSFNEKISLLDLYTSVIYCFNHVYESKTDSTDSSIICYNGSMSLTNSEIYDLYESLSKRSNSLTRDLVKNNKELLNNYFTRLKTTNFLPLVSSAGTLLESINSNLKEMIDNYFIVNSNNDILSLLIKDLSIWISSSIGLSSRYLSNLVTGLDTPGFLKNILNVFKPYRARLILAEGIYTINNATFDSVVPDDIFIENITNQNIDFDTANGTPSWNDLIPTVDYVISTPPDYDSKRILNIYIDSDENPKCNYIDSTAYFSTYIISNPPIGGHRVYNLYLEEDLIEGKVLNIEYNIEPETFTGNETLIVSFIEETDIYYTVIDLYINSLFQFEIVYGDPPLVDEQSRLYYSRNTYDNDSFFDIGASCDLPCKEADIFVIEKTDDKYNYHTSNTTSAMTFDYSTRFVTYDSTSYDSTSEITFTYTLDSTSTEIIEITTDGGWSDFDTGWVFDAPAFSDVCKIYVTDI